MFQDLAENPIFLRETGLRWTSSKRKFQEVLIEFVNGFLLLIAISMAGLACCLLGVPFLFFSLQFYGSGNRGCLFFTSYIRQEWETGRLESLTLSGLTTHDMIWGITGAKIYRSAPYVFFWTVLLVLLGLAGNLLMGAAMGPMAGVELSVTRAVIHFATAISSAFFAFLNNTMYIAIFIPLSIHFHLQWSAELKEGRFKILALHCLVFVAVMTIITVLPMLVGLFFGFAIVGYSMWSTYSSQLGAPSAPVSPYTMSDGMLLAQFGITIFTQACLTIMLAIVMWYSISEFKKRCGPAFQAMLEELARQSPSQGRRQIFGES